MFILNNKKLLTIMFFLIFFILVCLMVVVSFKTYDYLTETEKIIDHEAFQAIFLSNNQIYFGHLRDIKSDFAILKDVYYIQIEDNKTSNRTTKNRLVRLGETESHGPRNEMIINRDHILFWENLNFNSPIVQAIRNLQNK